MCGELRRAPLSPQSPRAAQGRAGSLPAPHGRALLRVLSPSPVVNICHRLCPLPARFAHRLRQRGLVFTVTHEQAEDRNPAFLAALRVLVLGQPLCLLGWLKGLTCPYRSVMLVRKSGCSRVTAKLSALHCFLLCLALCYGSAQVAVNICFGCYLKIHQTMTLLVQTVRASLRAVFPNPRDYLFCKNCSEFQPHHPYS